MDFDKIFPVIIFIIFILSLFGKKKPDKKDTSVPEKSALNTIISTIAKQLKEHAESAGKNVERPKSEQQGPWQRFLPKTEVFKESRKEEAVEPPVEDHAAPASKEEIVEDVLMDVPVEKFDRKEHKESVFFQPAISVKNLQNAVVWSEILGPPLALREDHRRLPHDG